MSDRINAAMLFERLLSTPSPTVAEESQSYLSKALLFPSLRGEQVSVGDIDFSAFDIADIESLMSYLNDCQKSISSINSFYRVFDSAKAVAAQKPSFC